MTRRTTERLVGALFIVASAAGVLSLVVQRRVVDADDFLTAAAQHDTRVATGAVLEIIMYGAIAALSVILYRVLKRESEHLALGYVVARTAEVLIFVLGSTLVSLTLWSLGEDLTSPGSSAGSQLQTVGDALAAGRDWANAVLGVIAFSLSALILNHVLRRAGLIPRWLATWGLAGAGLYLTTAVMVLYGNVEPLSASQALLQAPLGVQEMVFAVWLIAKGFNSPALAVEVVNERVDQRR
jgi:Domain of unknown function (DUF4386)